MFFKLTKIYNKRYDKKRKYLLNEKLLGLDIDEDTIKNLENEEILKDDDINSKYSIGTIELKNHYAIFKAIAAHDLELRIDKKDLLGAYTGDIVLIKKIFNPRAKYKAKVAQVLKYHDNTILAIIKEKKLISLKEQVVLEKSDLPENSIVLFNTKTKKIEKTLGNYFNDSTIDETISMNLFHENYRLDGFKEFEINTPNSTKRVDLSHLPFCTIDPDSAKDFDDAIYFDDKNSTLYVAIADVSAYVTEGSYLDIEAKKRAFTVYLPHKVYPMLPFELSNELCSLKPEVDRLAFVFKMQIDEKTLEVTKSELFEATINSKKRFTYGRIDRVLDNKLDQYDEIQKNIFDSLLKLYELSKKLKKKRLEKGFDFRSDEYRLKLDKDQELSATQVETSSPSHSLVEECMLLANVQASKRLEHLGIYRVHDEPSENSISKLLDEAYYLGIKVKSKSDIHKTITALQKKAKTTPFVKQIDEMIIRSQIQARYSEKKAPHFGLGFDSYSHFTSPIRRYADLVLHRILKEKKVPKDIEDICTSISTTERRINELVWDFEDRKYSRWALKNIGKVIKVELVDVEKHLAQSIDDILGLRVDILNYKGEKLYTKVKIKIDSVNLLEKRVYGYICK